MSDFDFRPASQRLKHYASLVMLSIGLSYAADARAAEGHGGAPAAAAPSRAAAPAASAGSSVSMTELRDMIDQKITEVRARREGPAVVRVQTRAPKGAARTTSAASATEGRGGSVVDPHGHEVHWAYSGDTGPDSWGRLKPEYRQCMLGKRQSPIDIRDGIPVELDPIAFDYRPSAFRVIDNGHTVQVNIDAGNGITVSGRRYELMQFHFHRPSEERVNGRQFEMVAHLVHKDPEGRLAVVAVLLDAGPANPVVQQVWNNLPLEKRQEQAALQPLDLNRLLPEARQYYTYMGSLTTPPCSEGVLWLVMKQPAGVSREQIGVFSRLYPMNARPVQPASGRLIKDGQ